MSGEEYEVESILGAKVNAGKRRASKVWVYWVKWKNYSFKDNTWEPASSFNGGSEHFIQHFWNRVETKGRDYKNINDFAVDEEFYPSGPPRRTKVKGTPEEEITPTLPVMDRGDSEREVRSIVFEDGEDREPSVSTRGSKRRRSSVGTEPTSATTKRKRGRPPGIPATQAPQMHPSEESPIAHHRTRSKPNIKTHASPVQTPAESSKSSPYRIPLPRRRGRPPQTPRQSSPSADELLLPPITKEKGRFRLYKKNGATSAQEFMDVDPPTDPPSPFGIPSLFQPAETSLQPPEAFPHPSETLPQPTETLPQPTETLPHPPEAPSQPSETLQQLPEAPLQVDVAPEPSTPAHRVRAANPRVKLTDDPHLTEMTGALAVKAKFMKRTANTMTMEDAKPDAERRAHISGAKAGPGRSSSGLIVGGTRLTAQKGKLTSVKPRKVAPVKDDVRPDDRNEEVTVMDAIAKPQKSASPPTGQELLDAAGLDATCDLPDFEEDAEGEEDLEYMSHPPDLGAPESQEHVTVSSSTDQVAVPPVTLEARPVTFANRITAAWNQSTIFGPLALGTFGLRSPTQNRSSSSEPKRYIINLNLDSAVSVPVILKDVHAKQGFLDGLDNSAKSPTGKFYKNEHAIDLVKTLNAQGSYARITADENSTSEHKVHFERFISRLRDGELFIQMNSAKTLVMCGSENSIFGQKLDFPVQLLGLGHTVVMAHVDIEDYSAYAEAAVFGDSSRW